MKHDLSSSDALLLASICRLLSQNAYHCVVKGFSNYTLDLSEGTGATNPNYPMANQLIAETYFNCARGSTGHISLYARN